ncbi:MAG TPA: cytochrome c oxidase subunit 3 [Chloroflexota bacterium]|nr:cytochrome c oxidase subunit 3 [Chloroflexota bacterium]
MSAVPASVAYPRGGTRGGSHATGWWGMGLLILTEGALFACLLFSYFYARTTAPAWPPVGIDKPDLTLPAPMTGLLLLSSVAMWWGERGIRQGSRGQLMAGLAISFALGGTFLALQGIEYSHKTFSLQTNVYGSLFFTITGFHGAHVLAGLIMSAVVQLRAWLGHFSAQRHLAVQNMGIYWHFVDVIWLAVFASLYLSPHLF